jgi:hypothetical protein
MLERDEHGHQLRDARNRRPRPRAVLREHFARRRILDEERAR